MKISLILFFVKFVIATVAAVDKSCVTKSGENGICKPITDCNFVLENLRSNPEAIVPCNAKGMIGFFCCPIFSPPKNLKTTESCRKVLEIRKNLNINSDNIIETSSLDLPFMAQILFPERGFVGAGVLLSSKFVLTAAHTVYKRRSMPIVRLGETTLENSDTLKVKQVIPHELYIPRETYYDVALLLLENSVNFSENIVPICLFNPQIELDINQKFVLSGWKGDNGKIHNELIQKEIQVVPQSRCKTLYEKVAYRVKLPDGITENVICGTIDGCKDSPDSDGPVHVVIDNTFYVYGIATSTNTQCNSELPGLYSRISDVNDWIENIISSLP